MNFLIPKGLGINRMACLCAVLLCAAQLSGQIYTTGSVTPSAPGNSTWSVTGDIIVGTTSPGTLQLLNGARVTASGTLVVAYYPADIASVTVNNSILSTKALSVGRGGTGSLTLLNGSSVTTENLRVGSVGPRTSTITVQDSVLNVTDTINLSSASDAMGYMQVSGTGSVRTNTLYVGAGSTNRSTGSITLLGASSSLTVTSNAYIGCTEGTGILLVSGSNMQAGTLMVSAYARGDGVVTVASGGRITLSNAFIIGNMRTGSVHIENGSVTVSDVTLGCSYPESKPTWQGNLTISAGGSLTASRAVVVGQVGGGLLHIDGGTVETVDLRVGSSGTATGTGSLTLSNGGKLNAHNADIGLAGQGFLRVGDARMTVGRTLSVGSAGEIVFDVDLNTATGRTEAFISADSVLLDVGGTFVVDVENFSDALDTRILLLEVTQDVSAEAKGILWQILGVTDPEQHGVYTYWDGNKLYLNIGNIPEPAVSAGLLGLLALAAVARRKR